MSKTKRVIASVVTVLMIVSMMTVITFAAETPVFSRDYVDPTGTLTNQACLADPSVAAYKDGANYVAVVDGTAYIFTVGQNAFSTIDAAVEGAEIFSESGKLQVLLSNASYGNVTVTKPVDIFGVNWNVNPNAVNPEDPTKPWVYNSAWDDQCSTVSNVLISGTAIGETNIYGIKITGRLYDHQRPISTAQTKLTFKNILFSQTAEGVANVITASSGRYSEAYAITFYNANSFNRAESGKNNTDEISLVNWRFDKLAGTATRLIDEKVSPKFTLDGCYLDSNMPGFTSQGWWMKWGKYCTDCSFTIKNNCIANTRSGTLFQFEGYTDGPVGGDTKLAVGCGGDDQYSEININNNLFYNVVDGDTSLITIMTSSYSKIDISNNIAINTNPANTSGFIVFWGSDSSADYSDVVTMRDNTVIGFPNYGFTYGNSQTKVDMTGTYLTASYSDSWQTGTSNELPTGKVRYDYCYLDAARTKKSSDIPSFTVNGMTPDPTDKTIELSASSGTLTLTPYVLGLSKYAFCESDADFSNADDYSESEIVTSLTLKNLKNYFLLIAYSYDLHSTVAYKITVNKNASEVDPGELVGATPEAVVEKDGLEYNVFLDRSLSEFTFGFDTSAVSVDEFTDITNTATVTESSGIYSITDIEPNKPVVLRFKLSSGSGSAQTEYFYVNITRGLSKKCDIISADGITLDGDKLYALIPGNIAEFTFSIELPEGAAASVWQGTTVYPVNADGEVTVGNFVSGLNKFTLGIVAENGVDYKLYSLEIEREKNTEAVLYSIEGAVADGSGFTATARSRFVVNPVISQGATFKVFADASCSQLVADNTVQVVGDMTVYVIVTSESGTNVSEPIALKIKKSDEGITVAGETIDANDATLHVVKLADNLKTAKLNITAKNATYKLYADKKFTTEASTDINLDQGVTYVYAKITYSDGETEAVTIKVISNRTSITYKDASSIPNWAKTYINTLNNSGTGILQGDAEGNFNASNSMTRYEVAAIAVRLLGIDATQYSGVKLEYADAIASWAENYVKAVTKLGIMSGSNDINGKLIFDGKASTTRSQLAKIIVELSFLDNEMTQTVDTYYNLNKDAVDSYYNSFNFADESSVQNWAKTYVKLAVYANYFNGSNVNGRNYISGKDNIKRSEIAAVCTRYLGL